MAATPKALLGQLAVQEAYPNGSAAALEAWVDALIAKAGPVTTTVPLQRNRVALMGDSLVERARPTEQTTDIPKLALEAPPADFGAAWVYGKSGRELWNEDWNGYTGTELVQKARAEGAEPDAWIIALGTNTTDEPSGSTATMESHLRRILTEIDTVPGSHLVCTVNIATVHSYPHAFHEAIREMYARVMAERGRFGYAMDWWAKVKTDVMDTGKQGTYFLVNSTPSDGTHMTAAGYQLKYQWMSGELSKACDLASTTVTSTPQATTITVDSVPDWASLLK